MNNVGHDQLAYSCSLIGELYCPCFIDDTLFFRTADYVVLISDQDVLDNLDLITYATSIEYNIKGR